MLIAAAALLPPLRDRLSSDSVEVLPFSDTETLRALEAIASRRPHVVALERGFASTQRGAAFINRIAADPALSGSTVRIISQEPPVPVTAADLSADTSTTVDGDARRVPRFELRDSVEATIDSNSVILANLSTLGAQVVSASVLKPNQRVRLAISSGGQTIRTAGVIIWARFEIPPGSGPRYRAGIEFASPDKATLESFIRANRKT